MAKSLELTPLPPSFIGSLVVAWLIVRPVIFFFTVGVGMYAPTPELTWIFSYFAIPLAFALILGFGLRTSLDDIDHMVATTFGSYSYQRIDSVIVTKRLFFATVRIKPRGSRFGAIMSFPRSSIATVTAELEMRMPGADFSINYGVLRTVMLFFLSVSLTAFPIALTVKIADAPESRTQIKRLALSPESNLDWGLFFNDKLSFRLPSQATHQSNNAGKIMFSDPESAYVLETDIKPDNDWIYKLLAENHIPRMPIHDFFEYIFNSPIGWRPLMLNTLMVREIFKNGQIFELSHPAYKGYVAQKADGETCRNFIQLTTVSGAEISMTLSTRGCDMTLLQSFLSSVSYGSTQAEVEQ